MGTINFLLPPDMQEAACVELERACISGGHDLMPYVTQAHLQNNRLTLARGANHSGYALAPWEVPGFGRLMLRSATVMERPSPYHFTQELARGTINQIRGQTADWQIGGLVMSPQLAESIRQATLAFGKTLAASTLAEVSGRSQQALNLACRAAEDLVAAYVDQVFQIRRQRQPRIDTLLGCRFSGLPRTPELEQQLSEAFNAGCAQVAWRVLEPREGDLHWEPLDRIVAWLQSKNMAVAAGPLVDFSGFGMPDWLWAKDLSLALLCDYMDEFIERVVRRYQGRVHHWQLTAGSNFNGVVGRSEDELLWLTIRLIETARRSDNGADFSIGLSQPFGDYMTQQERSHSPLAFADHLLRTGAKLAGLGLELVMGLDPRGSYCRPTLDTSRMIDLYSCLGVPLFLTLGYPSASRLDPLADRDLNLNAGFWRDGYSLTSQADWVDRFAALALCKPAVRQVTWAHVDDGIPHQFPHAGVVDALGSAKPALARLAALRKEHLQ
jgi:Glycosyl hydrolase family 10